MNFTPHTCPAATVPATRPKSLLFVNPSCSLDSVISLLGTLYTTNSCFFPSPTTKVLPLGEIARHSGSTVRWNISNWLYLVKLENNQSSSSLSLSPSSQGTLDIDISCRSESSNI